IRVLTSAGGIGHFDVADFVDAVAVLRRVADDEIKLSITLQDGSCYGSAHGRLNDCIDVARIEPVPRGLRTIDSNIQIRLPEYGKNTKVGNAANLAHLVADLLGKFCQSFEIWTDYLDGIGPFDAGDSFLDVVLDVLREVEDHSWQFILKLRLNLFG